MSFLSRAAATGRRRWSLASTRVRYFQASFGSACDVRSRFTLRQSAGSQVTFGQRCVLDNDLTIECWGKLQVGDRVIFGHHCTVAARESILIGDDCMFAEMVSIRDHDHAFGNPTRPYREQGFVSAPVRIGRNVWLGGKVTVCKGVSIGDNSVIGANAVVTRDIPANTVAVGIPARVIRSLVGRDQG